MYNFNNRKQAEEYLRGLTLTVPEDVVRQVVVGLRSGCSKYSLYMRGTNRKTGEDRISICSKGTVDKIKKLLDKGKLDPYVAYISQSPDADKTLTKHTEDLKIGEVGGKLPLPGVEQMPQAHQSREHKERPNSEDAGQDTHLKEHLDQVATTAELLASRVEKLVYYRDSEHEIHTNEGNIVDGLRLFGRHTPDNMESSIETYLARCVLAHYEGKFDRLSCGKFEDVTMGNASQELTDNLVRLANTSVLEPCPICPACQEIAGLPHIGRNWIRYKDEKTGKWRYMPEDF